MSPSINKQKFRQALLMRDNGQWHLAILFLKAAYGVRQ